MQGIGTRILIGVILLAAGIAAHAEVNSPEGKVALVGTWRLVSATYGDPGGKEGRDWIRYVPEGVVHLKHVTPTHFTVVTYDVSSRKVSIVGGGRYLSQDGVYKESVEYAVGGRLPELLGKEQTFALKIEGDRWTHSGTLTNGQRISEVWERIK